MKVHREELLALVADADSFYSPYDKKKVREDGSIKMRKIEPSEGYLKIVQRKIDKRILKPIIKELPIQIMGGRPGVSVTQNARHHAPSKAIMKYDVQNFFPSITYKHIYSVFRYRLDFCEEAANILTKLTTFPSGNPHVPQGAPTSTSLAILALEPLCLKLIDYTDNNAMRFSIWVDDITVSGDPNVLRRHRGNINHLVNSTPFIIHPDKDSGIIKKGMRSGKEKGRRITGITIDNTNQLSLGRSRFRNLKYRVARANSPNESLQGSLLFLRQVRPSQGGRLYHSYLLKVSPIKKK